MATTRPRPAAAPSAGRRARPRRSSTAPRRRPFPQSDSGFSRTVPGRSGPRAARRHCSPGFPAGPSSGHSVEQRGDLLVLGVIDLDRDTPATARSRSAAVSAMVPGGGYSPGCHRAAGDVHGGALLGPTPSATPLPMPRLAPVTTATRPDSAATPTPPGRAVTGRRRPHGDRRRPHRCSAHQATARRTA